MLRRRFLFTGLVMAVALGGVLFVVFNDGDVDLAAVRLGLASEFPVGSVTLIELDVGYSDPMGVEGTKNESIPDQPVEPRTQTRLLVVHSPESGLSALLERSPFLGCRVVEVDRSAAVEFGHEIPTGFDVGFLDPCHGGLFSLDGQHLGGPGLRGLDRFPVSQLPEGSVVADLTRLQTTSNAR